MFLEKNSKSSNIINKVMLCRKKNSHSQFYGYVTIRSFRLDVLMIFYLH